MSLPRLERVIKANYPLIYLIAPEETRAIQILREILAKNKRQLFFWTRTQGLQTPTGEEKALRDPLSAVDKFFSLPERSILVLADFHPYMKEPAVVRRLREAALWSTGQKNLIVLSPVLHIPPELEKELKVVELSLPSSEELKEVLEEFKEAYPDKVKLSAGEEEKLVQMARGLTCSELEGVLSELMVEKGVIDKEVFSFLLEEKKQIIRKSGVLEYFEPETDLEDVGGLDLLKDWLRKRVHAFSERARKFGLPEPKGLLLVGVQGCGKSLVAKSVAKYWRLPLLKLDAGRLFSGIVGSSEERTRKALALAEALSPVILWIDEIEKAFSGMAGSGFSDAGTASRVFATIVTWLQEKRSPVFVIATANEVDLLPPELLRKGRFDEIFFVDLPSFTERKEIFYIHLKKRGRVPEQFDLDYLAEITEGFSGAEIEQVVISGLYEAFVEGRQLTTEDMVKAIRETVPLSQMMAERISALRAWARYRARFASSVSSTRD